MRVKQLELAGYCQKDAVHVLHAYRLRNTYAFAGNLQITATTAAHKRNLRAPWKSGEPVLHQETMYKINIQYKKSHQNDKRFLKS
jgi:hypothetical protein